MRPPQMAIICEKGLICGENDAQKWALAKHIFSLPEFDRFFEACIAAEGEETRKQARQDLEEFKEKVARFARR